MKSDFIKDDYAIRTKVLYLVGKNTTEILSYEEYDADSGTYYGSNPLFFEYMTFDEAKKEAKKRRDKVFLYELTEKISDMGLDEEDGV